MAAKKVCAAPTEHFDCSRPGCKACQADQAERERERWIESGGAGKPYDPPFKRSPVTVEQKPAMTKAQARIVALKGCLLILDALGSERDRRLVVEAMAELFREGP